MKIESGDIIFLFDQNIINESQKSLSTNSIVFENSECIVDKVLARNVLLTEKPCIKPLNFKGDYLIGKNFYEFPQKNYKRVEEKRLDSVIDFYTVENLTITKNFNKFYAYKYFFHPGFLITKPGNTVFRMKLEKMYLNSNYSSNGLSFLRLLLEVKDPSNSDIEVLINSEKGILVRRIDSEEFNFYDTGIRTLFQESLFFDIILKDDKLYINIKKDSSEIVLDYTVGTVNQLYVDINKSDNVQIKDIRKINIIENKYLRNLFVYNIKTKLSDRSYWVEEFENGDICQQMKTNRKTRVEYRCDYSGNYDIYVKFILFRLKMLSNPALVSIIIQLDQSISVIHMN
jgi:hypothetical protein